MAKSCGTRSGSCGSEWPSWKDSSKGSGKQSRQSEPRSARDGDPATPETADERARHAARGQAAKRVERKTAPAEREREHRTQRRRAPRTSTGQPTKQPPMSGTPAEANVDPLPLPRARRGLADEIRRASRCYLACRQRIDRFHLATVGLLVVALSVRSSSGAPRPPSWSSLAPVWFTASRRGLSGQPGTPSSRARTSRSAASSIARGQAYR